MNGTKQRNIILDALKGIAIIAVALYHFGGGYMPYGYLGVDIFFVVGGFFLVNSILLQEESGKWNYWKFLFRKIVRLWPLILVCIITCLGIGYYIMLPDDYENLAESAIASTFFANNILQLITVKDYWDITNLYKPLMHLWYVGVLMQSYVLIPVFYKAFSLLIKNKRKAVFIGTVCLTVVSFGLYMLPTIDAAYKFYLLPFRMFEVTAGGLVVFVEIDTHQRTKKSILFIAGLLLFVLLSSREELLAANIMLIASVLATALCIYASIGLTISGKCGKLITTVGELGKRSYSIYIWHQVVIAFLFYSFFSTQTIVSFLVFLVLTVVLSALSYIFGEKTLDNVVKVKKQEAVVILSGIIVAIAISICSFGLYSNSGVVRDVPELDVYTSNIHRNMHSEYCDRPYKWDTDFINNKRTKILVVGNSFARDWANILCEWDTNNTLDISYRFFRYGSLPSIRDRIEEAEYVFFALGPESNSDIPNEVIENIPEEKLYIIGNKKFGVSNGIIYSKRNSATYFDQSVSLSEEYLSQNLQYSQLYGDHYIDMITPILVSDNEVRVFTDDKKFISQDCSHLTKAGAQYYSKILSIEKLLSR